jgi:murein L,D-transpeptidase YcbB/YkuD
MILKKSCYLISAPLFFMLLNVACKNQNSKPDKVISTTKPENLKLKTAELIENYIDFAIANNGLLADSLKIYQPQIVQEFYSDQNYTPLWFSDRDFLPVSDSLIAFIEHCRYYGLFPEDYHKDSILNFRNLFRTDTTTTKLWKNAQTWAKTDVLLTDAFIQLVKDLKTGRLPADSITLNKDTILAADYYKQQFRQLKTNSLVTELMTTLEPKEIGYRLLKNGVRNFIENADYREYTKVPSPAVDPGNFQKLLQERLFEGNYIAFDTVRADSVQMSVAVKKFQKEKGLTVDGVPGDETIRNLNMSDREKFIRIAISMDKYKLLPEVMPERYIWVNIPAYNLKVIENDSIIFTSKIICGKPKTMTPLLNSAISALITYPQWVPPSSIIKKEILPAVKKNPGYLARKGFSLLNYEGEEVDPYSVDWSKYNNSIPYKVVQGSGDDNALGIIKFHFDNKYSVYLHDTNQRYLFGLGMRSLSHGCVRVQDWRKLAYYILENDNQQINSNPKIDSLKSWLELKKKRNIPLQKKMPIFIRYITCEGQNDKIIFYDDPYNEDVLLREKYFGAK